MGKTVIFKPEFEEKLKKLRIKRKFLKNWKAEKPTVTLKGLDRCRDWRHFVSCAFIWKSTAEGFDYWKNIANS